ncbi:MAG TPA: hypothetical protein VHC69_00995 [Polyangiaceae bacterium]|nr:hypothetical protein [Polyangiaceae bacterium]
MACTAAPARVAADAAPSTAPPSRPPRVVDGGPPPDARVTCGDAACGAPRNSEVLGEFACCLPSGGCGLRVPFLGNRCLAPDQPGSVDPSCPSFAMPNGAVAQGCCTPAGRCGAYDRFGDAGCIATDTSDAAARCDYDASNSCRSVVAVSCDGPEDCSSGAVCCARSDFGLYDAYGCFTSCAAAEATARGVWFETCHTRADCADPMARCEPSPGLFAGVARCAPAVAIEASDAATAVDGSAEASPRSSRSDAAANPEDGIACGTSRCQIGGACCARDPGEPYCAPAGEGCSCSGPRGNGERAHD